jgi:hypothetical protein
LPSGVGALVPPWGLLFATTENGALQHKAQPSHCARSRYQ